MFVADMLLPEHPPICDDIEKLSSVFNITCCLITCGFQKMAVAYPEIRGHARISSRGQ